MIKTVVDTRKPTNPKTAKAKGRRLQNAVVKKLLLLLPGVQPDDIQSRSMGSNGYNFVSIRPIKVSIFG